MTEQSIKRKVGEIELFRFIFCIIVVCRHSQYVLNEPLVFGGGAIAVEFFFLVSGYLMLARIDKRKETPCDNLADETLSFVWGKYRKILPEVLISYVIGIAFCCVANRLDLLHTGKVTANSLLELCLIRAASSTNNSVNVSFWYVQSMLLGMAILYPLIRKFPSMMQKIVMPLVAIFLLNYLCENWTSLRGPGSWIGWTYKGHVRAIAELCGGGVVFLLTKRLKGLSLGKGIKTLLALIKWGCWLVAIRYMWMTIKGWPYDILIFTVLGLAVALSFSGQCIDAPIYNNRIVTALGKVSLPLYLGHWSFSVYLELLLPSGTKTGTTFWLYILCSVVSAAVIMLAAYTWRKISPAVSNRLKKMQQGLNQ